MEFRQRKIQHTAQLPPKFTNTSDMITILSPAKTLDYMTPVHYEESSRPRFASETTALVDLLTTYDIPKLKGLMGISESLAELNVQRYQEFDVAEMRQAIMTFNGHVYQGIDWQHYDSRDFEFAQRHLRILSGLYGILRPLDLIKPYRLEMGTKLPTDQGKNLYDFWGDKIVELLTKDLEIQGDNVVVNLASQEYSKAVLRKGLEAKVVTPIFKEWNEKSQSYRVIALYAKVARGVMTNWLIKNKLNEIEDLKRFAESGYILDQEAEKGDSLELVFVRDSKS